MNTKRSNKLDILQHPHRLCRTQIQAKNLGARELVAHYTPARKKRSKEPCRKRNKQTNAQTHNRVRNGGHKVLTADLDEAEDFYHALPMAHIPVPISRSMISWAHSEMEAAIGGLGHHDMQHVLTVLLRLIAKDVVAVVAVDVAIYGR
jgi:hypothetical protein